MGLFDFDDDVINVTGYDAEVSVLRIVVPKKHGERFIREILPELKKLGYVERYKKEPNKVSYYLSNIDQVLYLDKYCKLYIVKAKGLLDVRGK